MITPLPLPVAAPAPGAATVPMGADAEASAQSFAALVTQMLTVPTSATTADVVADATALAEAPPLGEVNADLVVDPATGDTTEQDGQADPAPTVEPGQQTTAVQPLGLLAALPIPTVVAALTAATVQTGGQVDAATPAVAGVDGADVAGAPATTGSAPAGPAGSAAPAAAPVATPVAASTAAPAATAPAPTTATTVPTVDAGGATTSAPAQESATGPTGANDSTQPVSATSTNPAGNADEPAQPASGAAGVSGHAGTAAAGTPATGTTPTAAATVAAPSTTATAPASTPAPTVAVTRQVFPEVTRLVSTGNGTHHVRLQLEPEALGDVRVVLTVRQGEVHVRLSAGEEAQRALREGAPELRRLLELAGASDTRIVVRDLPSGSAPGNGSNTSLTGQWSDGSGRGDTGVGHGDDRSQHQHAGTRGGSSAREGTNDGAGPHRPVQPVTHTRSTGVDVTM